MRRLVLALFLAMSLAILGCQPRTGAAPPRPAAAENPAEAPAYDERAVASFYQGKTVRFIVGFAPGGGFDTYTRTIARHIGKHIPGNPAIIVDNMVGGGSLTAANYVYNAARPDGLTVGNWIGSLALSQALGGEGIEFDARKYRFIGVPTPDSVACAVRKESGFKALSDSINSPQPLILGGVAPATVTDDLPKLLVAVLGANIKLVSGYSGTATIRQAADGGEVHGGCWTWESIKVTWRAPLEAGDVLMIGQATPEKLADLPGVEHVLDLVKTEEDKQLFRVGVVLPSQITRPYSVHPDTPPDRLRALRQAFMAALTDPEFVEEAQKARLDVNPVSGEEVERIVREMFEVPESVKARLRTILVAS
jgi:tripartite-type tricarboxylate transporter receptor subunit TctC